MASRSGNNCEIQKYDGKDILVQRIQMKAIRHGKKTSRKTLEEWQSVDELAQ